MRRISIALLITVVAAVATVISTANIHNSLPVVHAHEGCSDSTLAGNYGFTFQGFDIITTGTHSVPFAGAGVLTFDGAGNVSINFTTALNGNISPPSSGGGTYTVSSDCTGTASFTTGDASGETLNLVIVGGRREVLGMSTLNTQTFAFDAKEQ